MPWAIDYISDDPTCLAVQPGLSLVFTLLVLVLLAGSIIVTVMMMRHRQQDIYTRLRRKNLRLRHDCTYLQTIIDRIPNPVFYKDADLIYRGCNDAFAALVGRPRETIIGHGVFDLWEPEMAQRYDRADRDLLKRGGQQRYTHKLRRDDGTWRDVEYSKAVLSDETGQVTGLVGVMRDITETRQLQHSLHLAVRQWQQTFDSVPDLLAIIDESHRIVRVNRAMAELLDMPAGEIVGRKCCEVMHGTLGAPEFCPLTNMPEGRDVHNAEFHSARHGMDFWVSVQAVGDSTDQHGRCFVHLMRDITARKESEQQLQQTVLQLEKFNRLAVGRELRMIELKHEVNELSELLGEDYPYDLSFTENDERVSS